MARLKNAQWERFARFLAAGMSQADAYEKAGYNVSTRASAASGGHELLKEHPEVLERVEELRPQEQKRLADKVEDIVRAGFDRIVDVELEGDVFSRAGRAKALAARRAGLLQVISERGVHELKKGGDAVAELRLKVDVMGNLVLDGDGKPVEEWVNVGGDNNPVPGAATGLVVSTLKAVGPRAIKTHAVDLGVLSEIRDTERQIAQELGQWIDKREDTHRINSPEDIPDDVLDQLISKARQQRLEREKAGLPVDPDPPTPDPPTPTADEKPTLGPTMVRKWA